MRLIKNLKQILKKQKFSLLFHKLIIIISSVVGDNTILQKIIVKINS